MAAAPPFASYSSCTEGLVPPADWPELYASLQAHKAHVQEYPGCQRFDVFVAPGVDSVVVHCYTTWDTPEQRDAFLEAGYIFERLLADLGGATEQKSLTMEKVF
jgi:RimJ/RimL family protein N-acetyltransferase